MADIKSLNVNGSTSSIQDETARENIDSMFKVSGTQPSEASNKVWLKSGSQSVTILEPSDVVATVTENSTAPVQSGAVYNAIEGVKELIGSPLVASTAAGMTDTDSIYVYTGSETGYTAGNWYYYNGSAWTSGGVYNSTAVQTDKTLTVSDMAADGKKVGDEISSLNNAFEYHYQNA